MSHSLESCRRAITDKLKIAWCVRVLNRLPAHCKGACEEIRTNRPGQRHRHTRFRSSKLDCERIRALSAFMESVEEGKELKRSTLISETRWWKWHYHSSFGAWLRDVLMSLVIVVFFILWKCYWLLTNYDIKCKLKGSPRQLMFYLIMYLEKKWMNIKSTFSIDLNVISRN